MFALYKVQLDCNIKYSHLYVYRKKAIKATKSEINTGLPPGVLKSQLIACMFFTYFT